MYMLNIVEYSANIRVIHRCGQDNAGRQWSNLFTVTYEKTAQVAVRKGNIYPYRNMNIINEQEHSTQ